MPGPVQISGMRCETSPGSAAFVRLYVVIIVATVVALAVLSVTDAAAATKGAWVHGVIVMLFAVLLPLRLRSARSGSRRALRAVGLIAAVLLLVNVIDALVPGMFPGWMRVEVVLIAVLMGRNPQSRRRFGGHVRAASAGTTGDDPGRCGRHARLSGRPPLGRSATLRRTVRHGISRRPWSR